MPLGRNAMLVELRSGRYNTLRNQILAVAGLMAILGANVPTVEQNVQQLEEERRQSLEAREKVLKATKKNLLNDER